VSYNPLPEIPEHIQFPRTHFYTSIFTLKSPQHGCTCSLPQPPSFDKVPVHTKFTVRSPALTLFPGLSGQLPRPGSIGQYIFRLHTRLAKEPLTLTAMGDECVISRSNSSSVNRRSFSQVLRENAETACVGTVPVPFEASDLLAVSEVIGAVQL
jgi:hypothetical protein